MPNLLNHFSILIYPFMHTVGSRDAFLNEIAEGEKWKTWWSRLNEMETAKVCEDSFFFLPYIREVLFPEACAVGRDSDPTKGESPSDIAARIGVRSDQKCEYDNLGAALRLTLSKDFLQPLADFKLVQHREVRGSVEEHVELAAHIDWIDAILFPFGIGFLILKVRLKEPSLSLGQLIDLNYYLRTVHPPALGWQLPRIYSKGNNTGFLVRDLMDFLTQEMTGYKISSRATVEEFMSELVGSGRGRYSESDAGQVYGERCQLFSYSCIDSSDSGSNNQSSGPFSSHEDRLLYEFATCTPIGDSMTNPLWIPSDDQVARLNAENRFSYWRCWRGMALRESVVFLGTEDIGFNKRELPNNVESDYLLLYVYALYQKIQLYSFCTDLMRKGARVARHLKEVRLLMDRFVIFKNRYWFSEVTRKPMGGELYRKFQHGLEVTGLYDLANAEVKDLKQYYEERQQRHLNLLLNLFTFLFVPLGAIIGIFGMKFVDGSFKSFIICCLIVETICLIAWRWLAR